MFGNLKYMIYLCSLIRILCYIQKILGEFFQLDAKPSVARYSCVHLKNFAFLFNHYFEAPIFINREQVMVTPFQSGNIF